MKRVLLILILLGFNFAKADFFIRKKMLDNDFESCMNHVSSMGTNRDETEESDTFKKRKEYNLNTVSYTHLTLPTIYSV